MSSASCTKPKPVPLCRMETSDDAELTLFVCINLKPQRQQRQHYLEEIKRNYGTYDYY